MDSHTIDCDFFSIQMLVEDLGRLSPFFVLTDKRPNKVLDPRIDGGIILTSDPVMLFVTGVPRGSLIRAFHSQGITVVPNSSELVLSKVRSRRIDAESLINSLVQAGALFVYAYSFGMKSKDLSLHNTLDAVCIRGGAEDNLFHIGRSSPSQAVPVFSVPERNRQGQRHWNFNYLDMYPLFKHLGGGSGSMEFKAPGDRRDVRVKIYQLFTHWIKASIHTNIQVPTNKRLARSFKDRFDDLIESLKGTLRAGLSMGGFRIEVSASGQTLSEVKSSYSEFIDLGYFRERGLEVRDIQPGHIMEAAERAFIAAQNNGVFSGDGDMTNKELNVCVDLCNLIGFTVSSKYNSFLRNTGVTLPPEQSWAALRFPVKRKAFGKPVIVNRFDRNQMAKLLEYRMCITGGGYTLTVKKGGQMWSHRWWVQESFDNVSPESNQREFFTQMVKLVEEHCPSNWQKVFKLRILPRDLSFDLNEPNLESYERALLLAQQFLSRDGPQNIIDSLVSDAPSSAPDSPSPQAESSSVANETASVPIAWIVRPVNENLSNLLQRVSKIRYEGKRNEWEPILDTAMLEYVFQRQLGNYRAFQPGSEGYWSEACLLGLSQRGPDTLRNRWKRNLSGKYEAYRLRREAEGADDS